MTLGERTRIALDWRKTASYILALMKAKVFFGKTPDELATNIQTWVTNNEVKKVLGMSQSHGTHPQTNYPGIFVTPR